MTFHLGRIPGRRAAGQHPLRKLFAGLLGIVATQGAALAAPHLLGHTMAGLHKTIVIDAQGDSTMWGYQTSGGFTKSWQSPDNPPALLQAALQARFGARVIVQNNGVPGATLVDREQGVNGYGQPYSRWVTISPAHIVIVNFALNDADNHVKEPPAAFRARLTRFIKESRNAGRIVVLEEPNPVDYALNETVVPQYVAVVDELAKRYGLALVRQYAPIGAMRDWRSLLIDRVHPTDALYRLKAERQREVIEPIVARLME
ncbi:SGNH/GDSL hydrolase family protein [Paraburkholderia phymatum]|uniref:Lipolytic protein G-D-S-L family n=1 Tax=Paraburkholderia phymatum (strain DSM 17167 / CIP 108236 / LMG 21445 / STM815) TaxID=391038 RepID=B2JCN1_PARP8|nr:SGNH/GDSL hydrolase family protein [Paraburkholderia phymatum]ACC71032.1 lipolytic protein G-D-S-L family [Paraburkholderia phymatum STM815]